jgi:hypothetical protein
MMSDASKVVSRLASSLRVDHVFETGAGHQEVDEVAVECSRSSAKALDPDRPVGLTRFQLCDRWLGNPHASGQFGSRHTHGIADRPHPPAMRSVLGRHGPKALEPSVQPASSTDTLLAHEAIL